MHFGQALDAAGVDAQVHLDRGDPGTLFGQLADLLNQGEFPVLGGGVLAAAGEHHVVAVPGVGAYRLEFDGGNDLHLPASGGEGGRGLGEFGALGVLRLDCGKLVADHGDVLKKRGPEGPKRFRC
ncbi:hypothetical protein D9M70_630160 [compost metagenome]